MLVALLLVLIASIVLIKSLWVKAHAKWLNVNMDRLSTGYMCKQSRTALSKYVGGFWCETGGSWSKHVLMRDFFLLHKTLTDGLEWCGLLWCFYQLFGLSFWRHPFTAEHPMVSKWCYVSPNLMKKQINLHLEWPEGEYFQQIIIFFRKPVPLITVHSLSYFISQYNVSSYNVIFRNEHVYTARRCLPFFL